MNEATQATQTYGWKW